MDRYATSNGGNDGDEVKIKEFIATHENLARSKDGRMKIHVKDLREIIPVLVTFCFALKEPSQRKVKGMWDRPPSRWNPKVPFQDPNNKGDQGKPKRAVLMEMFEYLMKVYQKRSVQHEEEGGAVQVTDDVDNNICNPFEECLQRIKLKLCSIHNTIHLTTDEIKDMLFRQFHHLGVTESLMQAHEFECTLDIVKATNIIRPEHNQKWRKFEAGDINLVDVCDQVERCQLSDELDASAQHDSLTPEHVEESESLQVLKQQPMTTILDNEGVEELGNAIKSGDFNMFTGTQHEDKHISLDVHGKNNKEHFVGGRLDCVESVRAVDGFRDSGDNTMYSQERSRESSSTRDPEAEETPLEGTQRLVSSATKRGYPGPETPSESKRRRSERTDFGDTRQAYDELERATQKLCQLHYGDDNT